MASHFFVSGPAQVAVGTGTSKAMEFLGSTRDGVHVAENLLRRPVIADYAGPEMPADMLIIGKMVTVSMRLVWFDPAVLAKIQARHFLGAAGTITANEIGTLLMAEGSHFPLMVKGPYQSKTIFSANLPGIRVLNCFLDQGHGFNLSTTEQEHNLVFTGLTQMNPTTLAGTLWDSVMTDFPAVA